MTGQEPGSDEGGGRLSRIRDRIRSVDRGWKATLVGVVIALLYAVGVV